MKTDKLSVIAAERRQQSFDLRKSGFTYQQIGTALGISKQAAHGLIRRELVRLTAETEKDAHVMRALELERLDSMTLACWEKAMDGDPQMIDKLLKISERRSKFLGLDSPVQSSIDFLSNQVHVYVPDNGRDPTQPTEERNENVTT